MVNLMIKIELRGKHAGKFVLFDEQHRALVEQHKWRGHVSPRSRTLYASTIIDGKHTYAHHVILGKPPKGYVTDHKNGDGLDNQKENLHHITQSENMKAAYALHGESYVRTPQKRGGVRTTIKYLADGTPKTYFYDGKTRKRLTEKEALERFGGNIPERTKAGLCGAKMQTFLQTEKNEGDE